MLQILSRTVIKYLFKPVTGCFLILSALTGLSYSNASAEKEIILLKDNSCVTSKCHADLGREKFIHAPGVDGMLCTQCHKTIDGNKHKFKKIPAITKPLCAECHRGKIDARIKLDKLPPAVIFDDKKKIPHKPFAEGKCTVCHDPHQSGYYRHLKSQYPEGPYASFSTDSYGLCINCHKTFEMVLAEPRTLSLTQFRNGNLNLHYRHISKKKGRSCAICHHHHTSPNPKLINETFTFGRRELPINYKKNDTGGSCTPSCHGLIQYDRYDPFEIPMRTTPREGSDATLEELRKSRERDMNEERKRRETTTNEDK